MAARRAKKTFKAEFEALPSADQANERWQAFMQRLDALDTSVAEVLELGQLILLALREASIQTRNPLLGLLDKVVEHFGQARADYADQRRRAE